MKCFDGIDDLLNRSGGDPMYRSDVFGFQIKYCECVGDLMN